jgi:DNA-binding response OmpR family regulator
MSETENRILLVDPHKNLRNAYRMFLESEAYPVETAADPKQAIDLFSKGRFAVLITEFFLPSEDTRRMIQLLKEGSPETYVIVVTEAVVDISTYGELFDLGVDDLIPKPCPPEKVVVHIRKGLRQKDLILRNRSLEMHYFRKCLRVELKRAKRHLRPLSMLLIRIPPKERLGERFESFCSELGSILRTHTREEDTVARENGSFGLLLPETDDSGCQALWKRLSTLVETCTLFRDDSTFTSALQSLSFQSFTYPDRFDLPQSLKLVLDEIERELPRA